VELDPDIVRELRARGLPCLFGDAANRRLLERAGVAAAALVVVALPEIERAHLVVRHARALNPGVPVLARAHAQDSRESLVRAGATEVIQPELEAAATLIRHALGRLSLPRERVLAYLERFREALEMGRGAGLTPRDALPEVRDVVLAQGGLADQSLREARVRERFGVTVVGLTRADGTAIVNPSADTVLRAGDCVRVFGLPGQIEAFRAAGGAAGPEP
jgi:CPA2 family monovalent cation:H+ antiporter-2